MAFDNQSKGMHVFVLTISIVAAVASMFASLFQGMFVYNVNLQKDKENNTIKDIAYPWMGTTGYILSIVAVVFVCFISLYVGFDTFSIPHK